MKKVALGSLNWLTTVAALGSLGLSFTVLGCGTLGSASVVGAEEQAAPELSEYSIALTVPSQSKLPKCNSTTSGTVAYVQSPSSLWACAGGPNWAEIKCTQSNVGAVAYSPSDTTFLSCSKGVWSAVPLPQGAAGKPGLVVQKPVSAGAQCENGGTQISSGTDENGDGTLTGTEVKSVSYVCNGKSAPGGTCSAGSCSIGGTCYANGVQDPSNACRRCDTSKSTTSWSNSPTTQSCDDGMWCNGDADKCDGNGACTHAFPSNNRCSGTTGVCASTTCSESTKSCFKPETSVCKTDVLSACSGTGCSSDVITWNVDQYCPGNGTACTGRTVDRKGEATVSKNCSASEMCSNSQCVASLQCDGNVFCASGLCWTESDASGSFNQDAAKTYCANLSFASNTNWRLPSRAEFTSITRYSASCTTGPCAPSQGPGLGGCYWPIEMGACGQYWTSDASYAWLVQEAVQTMTIPSLTDYKVRCVASAP